MKMLLTLSAPYTDWYMVITVPADVLTQNDKAILTIGEIFYWAICYDMNIKMGYEKFCHHQQLHSSLSFKLA